MVVQVEQDIDALRTRFDKDGFIILRGLLENEVVEAVRDETKQLVDQEADRLTRDGFIADPLMHELYETRLLKLFANHMDSAPRRYREQLHHLGFFGLFFHPRLLDLAETFLGPEIRLYPNYTVRPKLPDHPATLVLWHQDGGYTEGESAGLRMLNIWTPLVPARVANGCMQFIPGTHKLGNVRHARREHYLEIDSAVLNPLLPQAVNIELDPGDVVLFHNMLFHCGLPNKAGTVRWSVDWRYQDATQPTMRSEQGHLARSTRNPEKVVATAEQWTQLHLS